MAACQGAPSYLFFPEERTNPGFKEDPEYADMTAKMFCEICPMYWRCRQFASVHNEHGIWGGLTEGERNKLSSPADRRNLREAKMASGMYSPLYPVPGHDDE